jgi:hypothetical protein
MQRELQVNNGVGRVLRADCLFTVSSAARVNARQSLRFQAPKASPAGQGQRVDGQTAAEAESGPFTCVYMVIAGVNFKRRPLHSL